MTLPSPATDRRLPARVCWVAGAILLIACGLRIAGIFNDFWIDEIISWDIARSVSATQVFTSVHNDNNHPLNTLWMHMLGAEQRWEVYRMLALVCGTITVALAGWIASKDGPAAAIFAMILCGGSYFLVQYSSEARGYGPAMMFALASAALLDTYLAKPKRAYSLAFAACAILGVCSHLTFLYIYLALAVWSFAQLARSPQRWTHLLKLHGLPVVFYAVLYLVDVRVMTVAAGPVYSRWRVIADTAAWMTGLPRTGIWPGISLTLATAIIAIGVARSRQRLFYASAILLAPALTLLLWRQPFLYPRYFVLVVPFFYLLVAQLLGESWKHRSGRAFVALVVFAFVIANCMHLATFYRSGRGQYLAAMRYMLDHRSGDATVGSMQDRRNRLMFEFYRRYLPVGALLTYVDDAPTNSAPPQWLIVDAVDWNPPPLDARVLANGARYHFDHRFVYDGLSGVDWYLFRRE